MLSFFRRIINSKAGMVIAFIVLAVIALAFAATDITGIRDGAGGGVGGGDVAKVGGARITAADLTKRVSDRIEAARQQQPTLDAAQFLAQGGLDSTLDSQIAGVALEQFGLKHGMAVSKRSIDGELASIPALQGPNGKFDPAIYARLLSQRGLTDQQVRADIARARMAQLLVGPTAGASQVSAGLALPYASLLLEQRSGQIAFIPSRAVKAGAAPTDAELRAYYARNVGRYTLPERRIARYALVTPASVASQPTEAEIAAAYAADRAKYAPSERRTIVQVVVADKAGAQALAAKIRGGTAIAQAARGIGLEALTQTGVTKAAYATSASTALADAVFAAPRGNVVGPLRGPIGWTIAQVEGIEQVPGKSLAQARDEIAAALRTRKSTEGLANLQATIDDALTKNATFDEVLADHKLAAQTTPALLANGTDPLNPVLPANPALTPIVGAAFQAQDGDPPTLVGTGPDGSFAIVALGRVVPAAPRPFADIRGVLTSDMLAERARNAARQVANSVLAKVNGGASLSAALAQTGLSLPAVAPVSASRAQLAQNPRGAQPPLVLMFSMAQGTTRTLEAPDNAGWYIVHLDRIQPGDARGNAAIRDATRRDLGRAIGAEYVDQFVRAVRGEVGVKTNADALAKVRRDLLGQNGAGS